MIGVIFVLEEDSLVAVLVVVMDVELVVGVVDAGLMEKSDEGTLVSGASSFGFVGSSFVVVCSSSFVSIVCSCFCSTTSFDGAGDAKEFEDEVVAEVEIVSVTGATGKLRRIERLLRLVCCCSTRTAVANAPESSAVSVSLLTFESEPRSCSC